MEELITNYFSNCKEFYQDVVKMLTTDSKKWDKQLEHMYMTWFGYKRFQDDEFDWLNNLYNRAFQCLWTICDLNNGIELLCEKKNKIHFKDLHSIYAEYLNTKFLSRERYSEERVYSNFKFEIQLFMDDNLQSKLLNLINNNNYPECRRIMRISVEKIVYFCISVLTLNNFVFYLRNILNNYRTFKIQLREAKVLSLNYIDYLLSEWSTQKELTQQWDNMMERWPILKEIQVNWSSPRQFINKVVYNTYITGYGKKFKENFYGKIWIYGGRENKFLVISKKNEHIIMTIEGTRVNADTISLKEKEEIKQIGEKILGDF